MIAVNRPKRKLAAGFAALSLSLGMLCSSTASAEPKGFPLVCRGGGNLFQLNVGVGGSDKSNLTVAFKGAAAGASTRPPERGECAWLDRGWRSGEPQQLTWSGKLANVGLRFSPNGNLNSVELGNSGQAGGALRYLLDALRGGTSFQVHAYREAGSKGQSFLRITRVGP